MGRRKELNRPHGLGGTDAIRIVDGKWKELWDEKTGKTKREDLSDILRFKAFSNMFEATS